MRLIDAETFADELLELIKNYNRLREFEKADGAFESVNRLVACPTIEAEPVRRGRWVKQSTNPEVMQEFHAAGIGLSMGVNSIYWTCSECGAWGTPVNKYCPNCGAKMDGGADNG